MDNQPSFDRSLLIPIFISGFSVVGIIVVLLIGRVLNSPPEARMTPSATPFQYLYLGTEPAITTPLMEGTNITEVVGTTLPVTPGGSTVPTPVILPTTNATGTSFIVASPTRTAIRIATSTPTIGT